MQQQSDQHIESFVPRFVQFNNDLRRLAAKLGLESDAMERFFSLERKLMDTFASSRQVSTELANAEALVYEKRLELVQTNNERDVAYRDAAISAHLLLAALERQSGVTPAFIQHLKTTLGSLQNEQMMPGASNGTVPVLAPLVMPTNLAVQRHDSGVIALGWQYDLTDLETQFEIAIAVGDGFWRGKPRDPEISSSTPEAWPERQLSGECSYIHEVKAKNGADIRVDTIIWFKVRAIRGDSSGEWSKLLEVVCHPSTSTASETINDASTAPRSGAFAFFGRRPA